MQLMQIDEKITVTQNVKPPNVLYRVCGKWGFYFYSLPIPFSNTVPWFEGRR